MVTSPHHLASQAGLQILREGGTAVEAAVATAACLAVVYPHMTSIGGDNFWLIARPGEEPVAIDACGASGAGVDMALYQRHNLTSIPHRGPLASNTVAGAVSGWDAALKISGKWRSPLPLSRILREAIDYAQHGYAVTNNQRDGTEKRLSELESVSGFAETFLIDGGVPARGDILIQEPLARTLRQLADEGLDGFYRGALSRTIAADLADVGAPITLDDLNAHHPLIQAPLSVDVSGARLFNMPPPTQGLSSLMILALFDRLGMNIADEFEHIHGIVEATKQAYIVRDREICDPAYMRENATAFLSGKVLDDLAAKIDRSKALPWPALPTDGDTVWIGVIDGDGVAVSLIQSHYFEFGSAVVLPNTGINWQNRGCSFSLDKNARNQLRPRVRPFHTLNPAMASFKDGRTMVYGTMGGEGQPQTQAAVFSRYAWLKSELQAAVTAPRWLLGRAWGDTSTSLKLENRVAPDVVSALRSAGHDIELTAPFTSLMGHAGAVVRHPNGVLEGATDPRSDGAVAAW